MAGSWWARVIAIVCSARLSWRSPPRSSRCWVRCPEEHGIGAVPDWRPKQASERNRSCAGGAADQQRRGQRAAALLFEQPRPVGADQRQQL